MLAGSSPGGLTESGTTATSKFRGDGADNLGTILGWGNQSVVVHELDVPVLVFVDIYRGEHARRAALGIGALDDLRTLAALWELPQGLKTPKSSLAAELRSRLSNLPAGAVESDGDAWVRWATPPVQIRGALVWSVPWRQAAVTLGAFVTLAPRVAVTPLGARHSDQVLAEAAFWGIGLVTTDSEPLLLLGPQPPEVEFGPYQWWLAECAYAAWLASA